MFNPELLESLVYDMPDRAGMSVQGLAQRLAKHPTTLGRELNPGDPGAKLGLATFVLLTHETGDFEPLDYMEQCLGRVAFTLPRVSGSGELHHGIAAVAKECSDVVAQLCTDLADGQLNDADKALKEISEAAQSLAIMRALVIKQSKRNQPPHLRSVRGGGHRQ